MTHPDPNRSTLWLPLLRALTERTDQWSVWKNADSALEGTGDVDSAAPRTVWPCVDDEFRRWARELRPRAAFVCAHIPRTKNYFVLFGGSRELLQLEVKAGATFRGSVHFQAEDIVDLSLIDARGFRMLRPGAEGLLKLLLNGMRRGGAPDWHGIATKGVVDLLRSDPEGARLMARRLGPGGAAALRGSAAVVDGDWDRAAMVETEAWAVLKAFAQPHVITERTWFRLVRKPRCPVLRVVYRQGRRTPTDVDPWLRRVASSHDWMV